MNEKPKCEEIGFDHAWQVIENYMFYATNPLTYPPQERKCMNCGKRERLVTIQVEKKEWQTV